MGEELFASFNSRRCSRCRCLMSYNTDTRQSELFCPKRENRVEGWREFLGGPEPINLDKKTRRPFFKRATTRKTNYFRTRRR